MPDITKCSNDECQLSWNCWRFNCPPEKYGQSYTKFEPQVDDELDEYECKMFIKMPD